MTDFPKPSRQEGKAPCGECRLKSGETCDICGAVQPDKFEWVRTKSAMGMHWEWTPRSGGSPFITQSEETP